MITLYAFGRVHPIVHGLTRDLRIQWALEELGLPYRVQGIDHTGGETVTEAFRGLNPFQQLPVIEDDGFVLTESAAILLYLAENAGALPVNDLQERATVWRWCFAALTTVEPVIQFIVLMDLENKTDEATTARRRDLVPWAERVLAGVETWLEGREYIAGAAFTVADILMTTVLRQASRANLLSAYPRCEAYRLRNEARPAWIRTAELYEARLSADPGAVKHAADPR